MIMLHTKMVLIQTTSQNELYDFVVDINMINIYSLNKGD